jgi:uridine phosphorylase
METAALLIISSIRNCRSGAIMSFKNMKETISIACEALKTLIEKDKENES